MPTRTVVFDRIAYNAGKDDAGNAIIGDAAKGDTVELSDAEAKRLDALGATVSGDAPEAPPVDDHSSPSQKADADPANPPYPEQETAKAAGIGSPQGTGVELHDNRLAEGLAAFLPSNEPAPPPGPATATGTVTDDELRAMSADKLVAHLNQHNEDIDRVAAMEAQRGGKARVSVTNAIESIRATVDAGGTPPASDGDTSTE
jgi:hypothetical protein